MTTKDKPVSVAEMADLLKVSRTTVRRWIDDGHLLVDKKQKPMVVIGGEPPLSVVQYKRRVEDATAQLKPGCFGWDDGGNLHVLIGTSVAVVDRVDDWRKLPFVKERIQQLVSAQRGAA